MPNTEHAERPMQVPADTVAHLRRLLAEHDAHSATDFDRKMTVAEAFATVRALIQRHDPEGT